MLQFIIQAIHSTKLNGGLAFTENDENGQIYAPRTQPNRTGQVDISIKTIKKTQFMTLCHHTSNQLCFFMR